MALVNKQDPKKIFASQAPSQDVPAEFNNYERGWDESRKNNGKPTIKQFNKLQQLTDEKILWIHQNGAVLPFDETMEYADGAVVVKDGELQQLKDGNWQTIEQKGVGELYKDGEVYDIGDEVRLENGERVQSTIASNTNNPNIDMTGWRKVVLPQNIVNIADLKDAETTLEIVNVAGVIYEWVADDTTTVDDVYYVQSNHSTTGRWVNLEQKLKSSAKNSLTGLFRSAKYIEINALHDISDTISLGIDRTKIEGYGDSTGFNWLGGDGPTQTDLALLKPVLAAKKSAITQAISNLRLIDFKINLGSAQNICGIDSRYITNNSKVEGVRVEAIGVNSVGFYISKQWYARFIDCYASGQVSNNREGIGVYLDTRSAAGTVNQVNAVMLDISVRELRYGYLIDPSRYVYSLIIPSWVTIEKCRVGLKVLGTDSPFIVRNAVISAYFEANTTDVEWGSDSDTRALDQKITWLGASFNDTGSKAVLNQGQHVFIGCTGLETLEVNNTATVKLENTYVDNIINNTGNPDAIINNYNPNVQQGASQFGALSAKSLKSRAYTATLSSGNGANPVTIDLANNSVFSISIPTRGQKARILAFARRPSDTSTGFMWSGTLVRLASGYYLVPDAGTWSITASIDNAGVLTLSSAGADTKYYDVTVTAM